MEPLVPDWRTLGAAPQGTPAATADHADRTPHSVVVTSRIVMWVVGALVAAALMGGAMFLALMPTGGGVVIGSALTDPSATTISDGTPAGVELARVVAPTGDLVVDVEGAVVRPGLVHVPSGGRVGDALARAGGFAANADLTRTASDINLAQQVTDGLKIVVPAIGQDPLAADEPASKRSVADELVDLNGATEVELDALPGVGPATIAKIVAARADAPFTTTEDLRTRDIVGDAVFQKLKGLVTVGR
jgi:competence protein ComEA